MMYVHSTSIVNIKEDETFDVKEALKQIQTKPFRRTDRYIRLALLGAHKAVQGLTLDEETALYVVSGQGDLEVFNRLRDTQYILKQAPKPVDFINALSNTTGFYISQSLGLHSKNLSLSNHKFGVEMALALVQSELHLKRQSQVLIGGVDELLRPLSFTKNFLGVPQSQKLGEGSNWVLLNTQEKDSLASLEVIPSSMSLEEVLAYVQEQDTSCKIAFGFNCEQKDTISKSSTCENYVYERTCDYYETQGFYVINSFIEEQHGTLIYISSFNEKFHIIKIKVNK